MITCIGLFVNWNRWHFRNKNCILSVEILLCPIFMMTAFGISSNDYKLRWLRTDKKSEREAQTSTENMRNWYKVNHEQRTMNFVFSGLWTEKRGTIKQFQFTKVFLWRCQQTGPNVWYDQTTTMRAEYGIWMFMCRHVCIYLDDALIHFPNDLTFYY